MLSAEGLLNPVQQILCLVALDRDLMRSRLALWPDRLHEGAVGKSVLSGRRVALARALVGPLLEELVSQVSRLLRARNRALLMCRWDRVGQQRRRCGHKNTPYHEAQELRARGTERSSASPRVRE